MACKEGYLPSAITRQTPTSFISGPLGCLVILIIIQHWWILLQVFQICSFDKRWSIVHGKLVPKLGELRGFYSANWQRFHKSLCSHHLIYTSSQCLVPTNKTSLAGLSSLPSSPLEYSQASVTVCTPAPYTPVSCPALHVVKFVGQVSINERLVTSCFAIIIMHLKWMSFESTTHVIMDWA